MFGADATVASVRPRATAMRDTTLSQTPAQLATAERWTATLLAIDPEARRRIVEDALASDRRVFARALYEDLLADLRPDLPGIRTPTLVLHAADPTLVLPDGQKIDPDDADARMRAAYRGMPNVTLRRIDGSRHFIMADQPARMGALIDTFLTPPSAPDAALLP